MSEVVTGILKLAFGFISNKVRTYGAEKLQDGGLTDQTFRGLIVRELDDIKFKLDANARKDLFTSISCLKQGVERLHMSLDESVKSGNPSTSEISAGGQQSQDTTNAGATSSAEMKPAQKSVTVEDAIALADAIGKLKVESSERYESARESFKEAGKEARRAFHNAALSTEERILASKVRVASGILAHLDDLEFAAGDCLQYLRELHDMTAVKDIFSVHVHGGIKSVFKKNSRLEIVENVTMINLILADFISKFTKRRMAVFDWPMIECGKRVVHPIHYEKESLPNLKEMEITPPWDMVVSQENLDTIYRCSESSSALNSKGDVIYFSEQRLCLQRLDRTTAKLQPLSTLEHNSKQLKLPGLIIGLAVDEDDTVYILFGDEITDNFALSVYSADGRKPYHCAVKLLENLRVHRSVITVTKDKNIVICGENNNDDITVHLFDSNGNVFLKFDAGLMGHPLRTMFVNCDNKILLLTGEGGWPSSSLFLSTYTQQGQLQRTVKLRSRRDDYFYHMFHFYNEVTKNTIGGQFLHDKLLIECLSDQTGELRRSYSLYHTNFPFGTSKNSAKLIGHTNGALTLVNGERVIFLQKPSQ